MTMSFLITRHHTFPAVPGVGNLRAKRRTRRALWFHFNRLTPNDPYMGRTAPLTSKRSILYIYSTNGGTEYFKHALYSPIFFSSKCSLFHNANLFGSCVIHILYTECAKIKKHNSCAKGLRTAAYILKIKPVEFKISLNTTANVSKT